MTPFGQDEAGAIRLAARETVDILPDVGAFFRKDFLVRCRFRAVLFEGDFRDEEQAVSDVCQERSIASVRCLSLDPGTTAYHFAPVHEELRAVRQLYHTPSYIIQDETPTFVIVSDSDYYWGFAATAQTVDAVVRRCDHLLQTRAGIRPFLESEFAHDRRIGRMLTAYQDVCDSVAAET